MHACENEMLCQVLPPSLTFKKTKNQFPLPPQNKPPNVQLSYPPSSRSHDLAGGRQRACSVRLRMSPLFTNDIIVTLSSDTSTPVSSCRTKPRSALVLNSLPDKSPPHHFKFTFPPTKPLLIISNSVNFPPDKTPPHHIKFRSAKWRKSSAQLTPTCLQSRFAHCSFPPARASCPF